jgi:hypothetical protein
VPTTTFAMVKKILDDAIAAWTTKNGSLPDLSVHDDGFGWNTKDQLANATAFGNLVIDPAAVGNGQAEKTLLVRVLRGGIPESRNLRMPKGGPYLSDPQIQTIATWINEGMP